MVVLVAGALGWAVAGGGGKDAQAPVTAAPGVSRGVVVARSTADGLVLAGPGGGRIAVSGPVLEAAPAGAPVAGSGTRWVAVRLTVRNTGAAPYTADDPVTAELRSGLSLPTGTVGATGCDAAAGARVRLAPGARVRVCALFGIPRGDRLATIVFTADRSLGSGGRWPAPAG